VLHPVFTTGRGSARIRDPPSPTVCSWHGEGGFINRALYRRSPRAPLRPPPGRLDQLPPTAVVGADVGSGIPVLAGDAGRGRQSISADGPGRELLEIARGKAGDPADLLALQPLQLRGPGTRSNRGHQKTTSVARRFQFSVEKHEVVRR